MRNLIIFTRPHLQYILAIDRAFPPQRYDTRKPTMNTPRHIDIDSTLNAATGALIALLTCASLFTAFVG